MMRHQKQVTYKNLSIGQEILGTKEGSCTSMFHAFVKSINPAYVTVAKWTPDGDEEQIRSDVMFTVEMTEQEVYRKYIKSAKTVYEALQNKLTLDQIGYHEMWNGWLSYDLFEMAAYCEQESIRVVGYSTDIMPETGAVVHDIGICAEYEDGDRFWCHASSEFMKSGCKRFLEVIEREGL